MKSYLGTLFDRLFRIVECNPEEIVDKYDYDRCISLLKMPFHLAKGFVEKMKELTDKIEGMRNNRYEDHGPFMSSGKGKDSAQMVSAMRDMKSLFKVSKGIEEKRQQFSAEIFKILEMKDKLSGPILERVNYSIENPK